MEKTNMDNDSAVNMMAVKTPTNNGWDVQLKIKIITIGECCLATVSPLEPLPNT